MRRKIFLILLVTVCAVVSCRMKEEPVITGISLDKQTMNLQIGGTARLNATISPASAAALPIVWTSSNTGVVRVSDGSLTAVGLGKASVIAASSTSGGVIAICEVTVNDNVAGITLYRTTLELYENETDVLTAKLETTDAENKRVIWTSSCDTIVSVDRISGRVYAKRAPVDGQPVKITATTEEGGYSADCMVTVKCHVSSIRLDKTELVMEEGTKRKLEVTVLPERATVRDYVIALQPDDGSISIDENNFITAVKATSSPVGITVRSKDEVSEGVFPEARCEVGVVKSVTGISITCNGNDVENLVLTKDGGGATLVAKIKPEGVTNANVNWKSSDESVATIGPDGVVSPKGAGYTTIIASSEDGGKTASCLLRVVVPLNSIIVTGLPETMYEGEQKSLSIGYDPKDATVDSVELKCSDISAIAVSSDRTVTAIRSSSSPVKITVTATSFDKGAERTAVTRESSPVTVACHPSAISISTKSAVLKIDDTIRLSAVVLPERADNREVVWSSTNPTAVSVSAGGLVTVRSLPAKPVYIVAATADASLKDSCEISVVKNVAGISILSDGQKVDSVSVEKGKTKSFSFKLEPADAFDQEVIWESTNENVATVSASGTGATLTAKSAGYTTLIVKSLDGAKTAWCKVRVIVPLTAISFDKTSISLYEGAKDSVKVTFTPSDATDRTLVWSSSDESAAIVIDGRIVALKAKSQTVAISASTPDGKLKKSCQVTVKCNAEAVQISHKSLTLEKDSTFVLSASVFPERASEKGIVWSPDRTGIATVDPTNGKVTAVSEGTVRIYAKLQKNSNIYDVCELTVTKAGPNPVDPTSVELNRTSLSLKRGMTFSLVATVKPANAYDKSVSWTSGNTAVATVDMNTGLVRAVGVGTASVKVTTINGKTATCSVTVTEDIIEVTSVTLTPASSTLETGKSIKLTATVSPSDATDRSLTWESDNDLCCEVLRDGTVNAKSKGTANITATSSNEKKATCKVTVVDKVIHVTSVSIDQKDITLHPGEKFQLTCTVLPENAADKRVIWGTGNSGVIVDNGLVTALRTTALVTVVSVDGRKTSTCIVNVVDKKLEGLSLDKTAVTMNVNDTLTLYPLFTPVDVTNKNTTWKSANEEVVTVSDGKLKAISIGQTIVTVTSGSFTATCYVTVQGSASQGSTTQNVVFDTL